jgi:uncharacterized protein
VDWLDWEPLLEKELMAEMERAPDLSKVHGLDHVERVWSRCLKLGLKLNADLEVLVAAAFLHDLGRHHGLEVHGNKSAELAKPVLEKIGFPAGKVKRVLDAIRLHDHSISPKLRDNIESQVLCDADKLDAFGAVGVTRWLLYYYAKGKSVEWIIGNMQKRYQDLHLKETKELAAESFEYAVSFFKRLREDLKAG